MDDFLAPIEMLHIGDNNEVQGIEVFFINEVLQGSLQYPCECPNHHLAMDRRSKWRRNYRHKKRNRLYIRINKRWNERPEILEDEEGPTGLSAFSVGANADHLRNHILPKIDLDDRSNAASVCKGWAKEIRAIFPPSFEKKLEPRTIPFSSKYYKVKITRGTKGEMHTRMYKCTCQCWDEEIINNNGINWKLLEPGNDEFEAYLDDPGSRNDIANIQDDPRY